MQKYIITATSKKTKISIIMEKEATDLNDLLEQLIETDFLLDPIELGNIRDAEIILNDYANDFTHSISIA